MNNAKEIAVIPKGTKVQIMGCTYTLLEDTTIDGKQNLLNDVIKAQEDFHNGVEITSGSIVKNSASL